MSADQDRGMLSSFAGDHMKSEIDFTEDSLPYADTELEATTTDVGMDLAMHEEPFQPHVSVSLRMSICHWLPSWTPFLVSG